MGSTHQEIGFVRDENKNQNMEISQLKEMIEFQDNMISQKTIKEIDQRMKYYESSKTDDRNRHSTGRAREKRPFRLIPIAPKKMSNEI